MTHAVLPYFIMAMITLALFVVWLVLKIFFNHRLERVHVGFFVAGIIFFCVTGITFLTDIDKLPKREAAYYRGLLVEQQRIREMLYYHPNIDGAAKHQYKNRLIILFDKQLNEEIYMTYRDWSEFYKHYFPDGSERKDGGLTEDEYVEYLNKIIRDSKIKDEVLEYKKEY